MRLVDYLDRGARLFPQRDCLVQGKQRWTFTEAEALTHQVAFALQASGIKPGDRVAVYSPNHAMAFVAMFGIFRYGAVWVPINARNALDENLHFLEQTSTSFLFYHRKFTDTLPQMAEQLPQLRQVVCLDQIEQSGSDQFQRFVQAEFASWLSVNNGDSEKTQFPSRPDDPGEVVFLIASGGTTGKPKGIIHTNRSMETMVATYLSTVPRNSPTDKPPVHLLVAPMTHGAGMTCFPLLCQGATTVVMEEADPQEVMRMIEHHKVTHLFLPPTVIYMMLAHPKARDYDYSSLEYFLYAAAPMSSEKLKQALDIFGPVMAQTFGQAEAPMICTYLSPQDHERALEDGNHQRLKSCGQVTPFTRLEVMDDQGNILAQGERGELVVRGGLVMEGYFDNPEATAEASEHGWHHTGDIGYIDEEGFVYIVDRKKDMIISGGFNVYPAEVEQVIWSHPAVQDCAVIGVPDEKWGEAVKAVVEPVPGQTVDSDEIVRLCKDKLGSVKAPKSVEVWETLPRSPVGKVLKKSIRERFWQSADRTI
ncbi:long-chain fatty acid--CoA ligase [Pseudomaricurvus alkylphenolicus]|uniref:acyl-CoA synthetase n=1 Tax=Pseudomaricurvus alkylphenolicus TaxID=1306991 RepID=UPI0014236217|nr:long-chain fatty acid--CoA ligase [Pseudomaricurvus alkylphenolicus]NIB41597.1 long-chain fatty acid--CoA ligase [Pseudomaricurvus alkylphenolicus]